MRRFFQRILTKPVLWLVRRFESKPDVNRVHKALTDLYNHILTHPGKKGKIIDVDFTADKIIIFSDQHKGAKNGSDDFMVAEPNYLAALDYYNQQNFHLISLGDNEELWENTIWPVLAKNKATIEAERKFVEANRFTKVFGNHDLFWNNDPFAKLHLMNMYGEAVKVYEGVVLQTNYNGKETNIFLTHGHQGDGQSDSNPFSEWFISAVWAPLQSFLNINPNTPAYNREMKTKHNVFMYAWSMQPQNPVLITGHTHQPVFASLTHLEKLYKQQIIAEKENNTTALATIKKEIEFRQHEYDYVQANYMNNKPFYFNSGCCCFTDGDITGIEIADSMIRLIKWEYENGHSKRIVLEEMNVHDLLTAEY